MWLHPNAQLIQTFYACFTRRDAAGMTACYHPQIVFSDPVFVELRGERAVAMWRMLCERGRDLAITFADVSADEQRGRAHWEARYTFSKAGRQVHNVIEAAFEFQEGKIIRHTDTFNLWRWAGMALGPTGLLLGWTPMVQAAIRREALQGLERFIQPHK
jgi:ketosteroid isomerase-like protein